MSTYENIPVQWFTPNRQPRSLTDSSTMYRPVSKNFNRISDFIFPDTVHIHFPPSHHLQQKRLFNNQRYQQNVGYNLPESNERDVIIVEHLSSKDLDNIDMLYHEKNHDLSRTFRRRYSSYFDERKSPLIENNPTEMRHRTTANRDKHREKRKRHTTDNAYPSLLQSMLDRDHQLRKQQQRQQYKNTKDSNYILSYKTTLDPITDSESLTSMHQHSHKQQFINDGTRSRTFNHGASPTKHHQRRERVRRMSSTISTQDSSSDTEFIERHSKTMSSSCYQQDSSYDNSSCNFPTNIWKLCPSHQVHPEHQTNAFTPINLSLTDINTHNETPNVANLISSSSHSNVINDEINNLTSSPDSAHHVSLCVNDANTTLFIDEDTLNNSTAVINNNNSNSNTNTIDKEAIINTFIDRIIKRLNHFKCSLDNGLIHVNRRNRLMNGSIITADYHSNNQTSDKLMKAIPSSAAIRKDKQIEPHIIMQPQSVLLLPNESAKFKCCFAGDNYSNVTWSHNGYCVPKLLATDTTRTTRYRNYSLHDIHYLDIGPLTLNDNGQIKCSVITEYGREEAVAQLYVVPSPADATPYIAQPLDDMGVIEGQPLRLSCVINGLQVTVNWFHNGKLVSPIPEAKSDYYNETSIFTLSCCVKDDAGTVTCHIKNRFGEAKTSCRVEILNKQQYDR